MDEGSGGLGDPDPATRDRRDDAHRGSQTENLRRERRDCAADDQVRGHHRQDVGGGGRVHDQLGNGGL